MNVKNNKRYKVSCEKIETAFLALLNNKSYDSITISEICTVANINRSTFYAHYDDINDLTIKIESNFANNMSNIFSYGQRQTHEAFVEFFTFVKNNKYFYKAFLSIPYVTFSETSIKKEILSSIQDNPYTKFASDVELMYRANFFGAGIKEICRLWLDRDCKETPEQMALLLLKEYSNRP